MTGMEGGRCGTKREKRAEEPTGPNEAAHSACGHADRTRTQREISRRDGGTQPDSRIRKRGELATHASERTDGREKSTHSGEKS